jgi:predicted transcriptional regulator
MNDEKVSVQLDLQQAELTAKVCNALSSPTRVSILDELTRRSMNVSEIAKFFYLSISSASFHVKMLNDAGLISVQSRPGTRGFKLCGIKVAQVHLNFFKEEKAGANLPEVVENIPVGNYSDVSIREPCGLVSGESYLFQEDSPYGFYAPTRTNAALIWFTSGYVSYNISNQNIQPKETFSVEITFEACSEAPGYDNDWPSDITLSINNIDVATHRIKGDYGGIRGRLNPFWWSDSNTQYGELIQLVITEKGCLLNGKTVSGQTISSLGMRKDYSFSFKISIKEDAVHGGGINLFGRTFGNHPQDILTRISYRCAD